MTNVGSTVRALWVGTVVLILLSQVAIADEGLSMPTSERSSHRGGIDWIQHTHSTLAELKAKLSLSAEQIPAWDKWSGGVIKDAHQQLDSKKNLHEEKTSDVAELEKASTPQQMTRGIERLHAEIDWMQGHMVQLEAAQVRTQSFYDTLGANQKTIFDLFWHEMYHRSAGHDEESEDDGDVGFSSGPIVRNHGAVERY